MASRKSKTRRRRDKNAMSSFSNQKGRKKTTRQTRPLFFRHVLSFSDTSSLFQTHPLFFRHILSFSDTFLHRQSSLSFRRTSSQRALPHGASSYAIPNDCLRHYFFWLRHDFFLAPPLF